MPFPLTCHKLRLRNSRYLMPQNQLLRKILSVSAIWIQNRPGVLSGLIRIQAASKGYQLLALVGKVLTIHAAKVVFCYNSIVGQSVGSWIRARPLLSWRFIMNYFLPTSANSRRIAVSYERKYMHYYSFVTSQY